MLDYFGHFDIDIKYLLEQHTHDFPFVPDVFSAYLCQLVFNSVLLFDDGLIFFNSLFFFFDVAIVEFLLMAVDFSLSVGVRLHHSLLLFTHCCFYDFLGFTLGL